MRIFFCGGLAGEWSSGWQRCQCLKELGNVILPFEQEPYLHRASLRQPMRALRGKFYEQEVVAQFNRDLLAAILRARPDVAWLEWPLLVRSETIAQLSGRLPGCKLVSFQDDNPFGLRPGEQQRWELFLEAIPQYDLHFVKRESDVTELKRRGARSVRIFRHGFYRSLFRPIPQEEVSAGLRNDVSFVGTPLDHRKAVVADLLVRHKVPLRIYGGRWNRTLIYHRRRESFRPPALGENYVRVICGSRISLGFVSSSNQDEYTMRTFEIPACKGFFLAERTPAHQRLFEEGKEAEFFSSTEECADKIQFYLKAESERARIAEQGYRRCLQSDYSLHSSLAKALDQIHSLENNEVIHL
jgi:hypothetical protein